MESRNVELDSIIRSARNGSAMSEYGVRTNGRPFYFGLMNRLVKSLLRMGLPVGPTTLLTVRGRKSGRPRTTPVGFLEHDGRRYVFGTFGEVDWTRNLRASGEAVVGRGWRRKRVSAVELRRPEEKALVLKDVLAPFLASRMGSRMLRMGYDLTRDSTMDDYVREAMRHPGFKLREK